MTEWDSRMHQTLNLLSGALSELDDDVPLLDQYEMLLKKGICAIDLTDFLMGLEDAFHFSHITMTETIATLYRQDRDFYEKITVAMIVDSWDRIIEFYGFDSDQQSSST